MASTPSSASTCTIIRDPDMVWPASGCPAGRGWVTVSLMRSSRNRLAIVRGAGLGRLAGRSAARKTLPSEPLRRGPPDPLFWFHPPPIEGSSDRYASYHRHSAAERGRRPEQGGRALLPPGLQHRVALRRTDG